MWIHFQLTGVAPKGNSEGMANVRTKMPTSVRNWCQPLDQDHVKRFICEEICRFIQMYNLCGIKAQSAWDFIYCIIFLDSEQDLTLFTIPGYVPIPQQQVSAFSGAVGCRLLIQGQMFHTIRNQMNNCRCDNPHAFRDQVGRSNPQTTCCGIIKCTSERFSS